MNKITLAKRFIYLLILTLVALTLVLALMKPDEAKANHPLTLNPDPGWFLPNAQRNTLVNCNHGTQSPAFTQWLSPGGSTNLPPIFNLVPGQGTITVRFNWASTVCFSNSAVTRTNLLITNATAGTNGILGWQDNLEHSAFGGPGNYNQPGTYRYGWREFTFSPPGGFQNSGWYDMQISNRRINRFASGNFLCVGGSESPTNSSTNFAPCNDLNLNLRIWVNPHSPTGTVETGAATGSCTQIEGWAFDADRPASPIDIRIRINGGSWMPIGFTNVQRNDVIAAYPQFNLSGPKGFRWIVPNSYKDGARYTVDVLAINWGPSGSNRIIGSTIIPNCPPPNQYDYRPTLLPDDPSQAQPAGSVAKGDRIELYGYVDNQGNIAGPAYNARIIPDKTGVLERMSIIDGAGTADASGDPNAAWNNAPAIGQTSRSTPNFRAEWYISPFTSETEICFTLEIDRSETGNSNPRSSNQICYDIVGQPSDYAFLKVYGSGVWNNANYGSLDQCVNGSGPDYTVGSNYGLRSIVSGDIGSSAEYGAASAKTSITGFESGVTINSPSNTGNALSFANQSSIATVPGNYYGNDNAPAKCFVDLFSTLSGGSATLSSWADVDGASYGGQDVFTKDADLALLGSSVNVDAATDIEGKVVVVIDGDLNIGAPIIYSNSYGTGNNLTIPSLIVAVRGDINIGPGVGQLDGLFIAIPRSDGTGGVINTCGSDPLAISDQCKVRLEVNGAFMAADINFYRYPAGIRDVTNPNDQDPHASEVFKFNPELYISNPLKGLVDPTSTPGLFRYESYDERAPVY